MNYKRIGDYIQLVDNRNKDLAVTNLLGINITKNFMPSVANTSESDLSKYKIIQQGQFAYSAMQVGRDETIRLALYEDKQPAIISPAYLVIESKDINELLPEYMMMWFQRPESDRYGWFISDSSVRAISHATAPDSQANHTPAARPALTFAVRAARRVTGSDWRERGCQNHAVHRHTLW